MLKRLLLLLFFWGSLASAQYVPFTLAAQQHGGTTGPSNFAYVASSVTGCISSAAANKQRCAQSFHTNPATGQLLVAFVTWKSTTATASFGCTNNSSFTAAGSPKIDSTNAFSSQMFYVFSAVTGANPDICEALISAAVGYISWEAAQYTYTGTLSATDGTPQYVTTTAVSGVGTISGLTTSNSSDLVWSSCMVVDSSCSVGAGYTSRNDTNACLNPADNNASSCPSGTTGTNFNTNSGLLFEDKVNVAAGAQSATFGMGTTDHFVAGLIAF